MLKRAHLVKEDHTISVIDQVASVYLGLFGYLGAVRCTVFLRLGFLAKLYTSAIQFALCGGSSFKLTSFVKSTYQKLFIKFQLCACAVTFRRRPFCIRFLKHAIQLLD